jgi:hypothetical protein
LSADSVFALQDIIPEENENLKKFIRAFTLNISYQNDNGLSYLGQSDPTKAVIGAKKWLTQLKKEKKRLDFGFLVDFDKKYLAEAGPRLLNVIKEKPAETYIYLTTGSRLLPYFVKGLTEDILPKDKTRPESRYIQCSRDAKKEEKDLIFERVKEVVQSTKPPYLIIDDYVSESHATFDIIKEAFKNAGVKEEDIKFFAFIAEKEDLQTGKKIPETHYTSLGINIGVQDEMGSSYGFYFNRDVLKKTQKNRESKYENVIEESNKIYDSFANVKTSDLRKNARKSLYYLGKSVAKKQNSH